MISLDTMSKLNFVNRTNSAIFDIRYLCNDDKNGRYLNKKAIVPEEVIVWLIEVEEIKNFDLC